MNSRSYNLSFTITGRVSVTAEQVKETIVHFNEAVAQKRDGHQMIAAVTGGAPVDETNFDKVYETAMRAGFRRAIRGDGLEDFRGLEGAQAAVTLKPRGTARTVDAKTLAEALA